MRSAAAPPASLGGETLRDNAASTKDELKDARKLLEEVNKYRP